MRRTLAALAFSLLMGVFGAVAPANAAAFLWISAPGWSYSGATCSVLSGGFYAWFMTVGAGSSSYAYTTCSDAFGSSASFAVAQAGLGGAGAAFVAGLADPYAGVGIDSNLTTSNISGESYGSYADTQSHANSEMTGTSYTISNSGITFGNESSTSLNGVDELAAYYYTGTSNQFCTAIGAGTGCSSGSTSGSDVTDINTLQNKLGLTPLGTLMNPSNGAPTLNFNSTPLDTNNIILVGEGQTNAPEPASLLLLGQGLLGLVAFGRWRRRR